MDLPGIEPGTTRLGSGRSVLLELKVLSGELHPRCCSTLLAGVPGHPQLCPKAQAGLEPAPGHKVRTPPGNALKKLHVQHDPVQSYKLVLCDPVIYHQSGQKPIQPYPYLF